MDDFHIRTNLQNVASRRGFLEGLEEAISQAFLPLMVESGQTDMRDYLSHHVSTGPAPGYGRRGERTVGEAFPYESGPESPKNVVMYTVTYERGKVICAEVSGHGNIDFKRIETFLQGTQE